MGWQEKTAKIGVGDKASFLRSTGQYTGAIPHARGVVTEIKKLGDNALAVVDWAMRTSPRTSWWAT